VIFKEEVVGGRGQGSVTTDNRRGTGISSGLKRDETAPVDWLTGSENFVREIIGLCMRSSTLAIGRIQEQE